MVFFLCGIYVGKGFVVVVIVKEDQIQNNKKNGSEFIIYGIGFSSLGKSWRKGSRLKDSVSHKKQAGGLAGYICCVKVILSSLDHFPREYAPEMMLWFERRQVKQPGDLLITLTTRDS